MHLRTTLSVLAAAAFRTAAAVLPAAAAALLACAATPPALRVGTSGDYRPFSVLSAGGYRGFDIAVAERFARDTGSSLAWVPFRWPELLDAMKAGRFDAAMSGVTVRPERSIAGRFTVPVAETAAVVLVADDAWRRLGLDPDGALDQLDRAAVRLAVNAGGHLERVTRARFRSARIHAIPDNGAVRAALAAGEVDAIVTDTLEAPGWLQGLEGVRQVGPFGRDWKAYWIRADDAPLALRLDDWLIAAERDGLLAKLRAEWFGEAAGRPTATPLVALLAASDERLALMTSVAEAKRARGIPVVDPEREARVLEAAWSAVTRAARRAGGEAPPRPAVERFYRAQIDAAVAIQRRVLAGPRLEGGATFDLESEIRPALIRIGDRMANLLVLTARDPRPGDALLRSRVADALARHRLPPERARAIADAIAGLGG